MVTFSDMFLIFLESISAYSFILCSSAFAHISLSSKIPHRAIAGLISVFIDIGLQYIGDFRVTDDMYLTFRDIYSIQL